MASTARGTALLLLIVSVTLIVAATTMPWSTYYVGHSHWAKVEWVPFSQRVRPVDFLLNILLFLPFGYSASAFFGRDRSFLGRDRSPSGPSPRPRDTREGASATMDAAERDDAEMDAAERDAAEMDDAEMDDAEMYAAEMDASETRPYLTHGLRLPSTSRWSNAACVAPAHPPPPELRESARLAAPGRPTPPGMSPHWRRTATCALASR